MLCKGEVRTSLGQEASSVGSTRGWSKGGQNVTEMNAYERTHCLKASKIKAITKIFKHLHLETQLIFPIYQSTCQHTYPQTYLPTQPPTLPSIHPSIHSPIHSPSIHSSVPSCISFTQFIHLSIHSFILSIHMHFSAGKLCIRCWSERSLPVKELTLLEGNILAILISILIIIIN